MRFSSQICINLKHYVKFRVNKFTSTIVVTSKVQVSRGSVLKAATHKL
jgi:hypothetical protein